MNAKHQVSSRELSGYFIAGLMLCYFLLKPINNWDIIGYLASLFWLEGLSPSDIHELTYSSLQAVVSPDRFKMLAEAGAYHSAVYGDPNALMAQIPFYAPRLLLLGMARGLGALGIEPVQALHLINASAMVLLWLLLARWVVPVHKSSWWLLLLIFALSGAFSLGRTVTPDALSALVAFASVLACLSKHRLAWLGPLLLPLARTDYVLLSGLLCLWQFWQSKQLRWLIVATLSGAIMLALNHWAGHYGYRIIMQFTLLDAAAYPGQMAVTWGLADYPAFVLGGLRELASGTAIWLVLVSLIYARARRLRFTSDEKSIVGLVLIFFLMHFLVFPAGFQRFYVGCALLVLGAVWRAHVRDIRPQISVITS